MEVDLDGLQHVRARGLRAHHVLGRELADARERQRLGAGRRRRRGRGRRRCACGRAAASVGSARRRGGCCAGAAFCRLDELEHVAPRDAAVAARAGYRSRDRAGIPPRAGARPATSAGGRRAATAVRGLSAAAVAEPLDAPRGEYCSFGRVHAGGIAAYHDGGALRRGGACAAAAGGGASGAAAGFAAGGSALRLPRRCSITASTVPTSTVVPAGTRIFVMTPRGERGHFHRHLVGLDVERRSRRRRLCRRLSCANWRRCPR